MECIRPADMVAAWDCMLGGGRSGCKVCMGGSEVGRGEPGDGGCLAGAVLGDGGGWVDEPGPRGGGLCDDGGRSMVDQGECPGAGGDGEQGE